MLRNITLTTSILLGLLLWAIGPVGAVSIAVNSTANNLIAADSAHTLHEAIDQGASPDIPIRAGSIMPKSGIDLLQFTAGGHVLGFSDRGLYVATGDHALKTEFAGASRVTPQVRGGSRSASSKAPPMHRVTYKNLWDGVTLVYDRDPGGIVRSTYRIAPHAKSADPVKRIRLAYNVTSVKMDAGGNLVLGFETGNMVKSAPVAWQEIRGKKIPVEVSFTVSAKKMTGFHVGTYDPAWPLIIDPTLTWNTFLGGNIDDFGNGIAVDANSNVYVIGTSRSSWGAPARPFAVGTNTTDAFAAKLDANGVLVWNTFLGSNLDDLGHGIAVDTNGDVYVTGNGVPWGTPPAGQNTGDSFVAKLGGANGALMWNIFFGATNDQGRSIAVDTVGGVYVTGISLGSWGTPVSAFNGSFDAFVVKLNAANGTLTWNTFLGSVAGGDQGFGIAVKADGSNVYVAGRSFGVTWGAPVRAYSVGFADAFAAKLDATGHLLWNTFLGSAGSDFGNGIAIDAGGNVYVTGQSDATWGAPAPVIRPFAGGTEAFAAKLDAAGGLVWNTFLGSTVSGERGSGIAVDGNSNVYVTGDSNATWGSPPASSTFAGGTDAFAAKLDATGGLVWNSFLGHQFTDTGNGIALDSNLNIYVTGDSGATWGSPKRPFSAGNDAFVAKIDNATAPPPPPPSVPPAPLAVDDTVISRAMTVTTGNVLDNDIGSGLFVSAFDVASVNGGAIVFNGNGVFTYTRPANFIGNDFFTYTIKDSLGRSSSGTVTVAVNGPPSALWVNKYFFRPGDSLVISASVTPGTLAGRVVDVYITIRLPGGQTIYLIADGSTSLTPAAYASNWPVSAVTGVLFNYVFQGAEPLGGYAVNGFFTAPGTMTSAGVMAGGNFYFLP